MTGEARTTAYRTSATTAGLNDGMAAAREWRDRNRNVVWQPVFEQRPLRRMFTEHMPFKGHRTCAEWGDRAARSFIQQPQGDHRVQS